MVGQHLMAGLASAAAVEPLCSSRALANPWASSLASGDAVGGSSAGLSPGDARALAQAARDMHELCIRRGARGTHGGSVYVGSAGTAYMQLRFVQAQEPQGGAGAPALRALAAAAEASAAHIREERVTLLEGRPGASCVAVACLMAAGEVGAARAAAAAVLAAVEPACASLPPGECEVLYGRAGVLQAVLFARDALGEPAWGAAEVSRLVGEIVAAGAAGAASGSGTAPASPLLWSWHDKVYCGAAHGLAGVLHTLVRSGAPEGRSPRVRAAVEALVAAQLPSGNLPSSASSPQDRLVQWCHGAPGLLPLLRDAGEAWPELRPAFAAAAERAAEAVWQRGLLRKGAGLCHGWAGNAYALLAAAALTGRREHLRRAALFALFTAEHWADFADVPDRPTSLFEGLAGAVLLLLDLLAAHDAGHAPRPVPLLRAVGF